MDCVGPAEDKRDQQDLIRSARDLDAWSLSTALPAVPLTLKVTL